MLSDLLLAITLTVLASLVFVGLCMAEMNEQIMIKNNYYQTY